MGKVKFSPGNTEMGSIPSVSLPSRKTCKHCPCWDKCYAYKIERLRRTVREAYQNNLDVLLNDPDTYWREVEGEIMMNRYFRFHVSGDIPNDDYLSRIIRIARRNSHCQVLCFTKKHELVNEHIDNCGGNVCEALPNNLHLILSGWPGMSMSNPYGLPEAHVVLRDGTTSASPDAKECGGNCTECAITDSGCWTLGYNEQIVFHEH